MYSRLLQMQKLGLAAMHRNDENIKHFVGMFDGIAFLNPHQVQAGLQFVRRSSPDNLFEPLINYIEKTCDWYHEKNQ